MISFSENDNDITRLIQLLPMEIRVRIQKEREEAIKEVNVKILKDILEALKKGRYLHDEIGLIEDIGEQLNMSEIRYVFGKTKVIVLKKLSFNNWLVQANGDKPVEICTANLWRKHR